jgi:hypothetical protein
MHEPRSTYISSLKPAPPIQPLCSQAIRVIYLSLVWRGGLISVQKLNLQILGVKYELYRIKGREARAGHPLSSLYPTSPRSQPQLLGPIVVARYDVNNFNDNLESGRSIGLRIVEALRPSTSHQPAASQFPDIPNRNMHFIEDPNHSTVAINIYHTKHTQQHSSTTNADADLTSTSSKSERLVDTRHNPIPHNLPIPLPIIPILANTLLLIAPLAVDEQNGKVHDVEVRE